MKALNASFLSIVLSLCAMVPRASADSHLIEVNYWESPPWDSGIIYSVPAGANYEWAVSGSAYIALGGGGLNVQENGTSGFVADVGNTSYADSISYQLSAYNSDGYAMFYLGW